MGLLCAKLCAVPRRPPQVVKLANGEIAGQTDWRPAVEGVNSVIYLAGRVYVMHENLTDPLR